MMTPRVRARPPFALPAMQAPQLRALIDGNHAIDLPIRMRVVLPLEVFLAVDSGHVHRGH